MEIGVLGLSVLGDFPLMIPKQRKKINEGKKCLFEPMFYRGVPHSYTKGRGHMDMVTQWTQALARKRPMDVLSHLHATYARRALF